MIRSVMMIYSFFIHILKKLTLIKKLKKAKIDLGGGYFEKK